MGIDSRGRITVVGNSFLTKYEFFLTRYNPDGSLDMNFGKGGLVTGDIGGEGGYSSAGGLAIDSLGRIVVAGSTATVANRARSSMALARYNSDGFLDLTFGNGGIVVTDTGGLRSGAGGVAIDSLGNVVVAGYSDNTFTLARYNSDGSLDSTFGAGAGIVAITNIGVAGGYGSGGPVAIDSLGRIVAGGAALMMGHTGFALVRCNSDGTLDTSFGNGGKVTNGFSGPGSAGGIIIDNLGRIVGVNVCPSDCGSFYFELVRYNSDGSLDNTFGDGGLIITPHLGANSSDSSNAIAIDGRGRIVVAGSLDDFVPGFGDDYYSALVRYNPDGSLDNTFGNAIVPVPVVTGLRFDRTSVLIGSSYSLYFLGPNLDDGTFFDVRFTAPGSNDSVVAVNWQQGLAASHSVPAGITSGDWTINGVRAHTIETDHTGNFVPVSATITVSP
jgi:uncharacterized delta-60 repeat protein